MTAFNAIIERHREALRSVEYRYLYEDIQSRRALIMVELSSFAEALPILREAISFNFDNIIDAQQVHFALAVCLANTNDSEEAKREFKRVVQFGTGSDIEQRALYRLAILYYESGALAQAKQQLETILSDFPVESSALPRREVYRGLSQTFGELGDKANQQRYLELANRDGLSES